LNHVVQISARNLTRKAWFNNIEVVAARRSVTPGPMSVPLVETAGIGESL
jgi:hypothetical protein